MPEATATAATVRRRRPVVTTISGNGSSNTAHKGACGEGGSKGGERGDGGSEGNGGGTKGGGGGCSGSGDGGCGCGGSDGGGEGGDHCKTAQFSEPPTGKGELACGGFWLGTCFATAAR